MWSRVVAGPARLELFAAELTGSEPRRVHSPPIVLGMSATMPETKTAQDDAAKSGEKRPRIAVVGMSLEASVYSPARTRIDMFARRNGQEIIDEYGFLASGTPIGDAAEWVPLVHYRSIPGGAIPKADYLEMRRTITDALAAASEKAPFDGVLLDLHGAMSVVDDDGEPFLDPEGDLATEVRKIVGPDALLSSGMDLHGNMSVRLCTELDLLTCYRMAPHEDWLDTKERSARNLVERLQLPAAERRPAKARVAVPILLPGEMTSTRLEPAKSLYRMVPKVEALPGILDAGIWIGYPWADEPRNHATIVVTGDDEVEARQHAESIARAMWDRREEFSFVAPTGTLDECLRAAFASDARPYFVSDSGDNPTAGGAGDVTWTLARLLERPELQGDVRAVYASLPDEDAAKKCVAAGVGAEVDVVAGARIDDGPEKPARIRGVIECIRDDDPVAKTEIVIRSGSLAVILTERRKPYHLASDFERLGLPLAAQDLVVVKIGYLEPELFDASADWILALTPGGVDQDLQRLPHPRIQRPMFPFDRENFDPDLTAKIIGR